MNIGLWRESAGVAFGLGVALLSSQEKVWRRNSKKSKSYSSFPALLNKNWSEAKARFMEVLVLRAPTGLKIWQRSRKVGQSAVE